MIPYWLDPLPANPLTFLAPLNGSLVASERQSPAHGDGRRKDLTLTGSGAIRYQAARNARINLWKNPSAEVDLTGWVTTGGTATLSRITTDSARGAACFELSATTIDHGMSPSANDRTTMAMMASVVAHVFSFDVKLVSGAGDWYLAINERNASGSSLASSVVALTVASGWNRVAFVYTPTAIGTDHLTIKFLRNSTAASTILIDGGVLESGASASPIPTHFDGSTGGAWVDPITGFLGTAHASPSVSQAALWAEEGVTNTIPDPIFGNAAITNYWAAVGLAAISKIATHAYLGSASGKAVCTAAITDGIEQLSTSGGAAATAQVWTLNGHIRAFAAGDVGKTVKPVIVERTSLDVEVLANTGSAITLTDAPQAFSYTVTLSGGATTAKVTARFVAGAAVAVDFVLLDAQLANKAYATSVAAGSLGTGDAWSGTAHASNSVRTICNINTTGANRWSGVKSAIHQLICPKLLGTTRTYFDTSGSDEIAIENVSNAVDFYRSGYGVARTGALAVDDWDSVVADWSGNTIHVYDDNNAGDDATGTAPGPVVPTTLYIGNSRGLADSSNAAALIASVAVFDRPLTAKERARLAVLDLVKWDSLQDVG